MTGQRPHPGLTLLDAPGRVRGVDLARGLAVIGMVAAHLVIVDPFDVGDPTTWADVVNGRSSILFAVLAGVSIGLVTGGPRPLRGSARLTASARLVVRAALLWFLGVLLIATRVPIENILPAYALLFLLALPFLGLPARVVLPTAAGLALVTPSLLLAVNAATDGLGGAEIRTFTGWYYPALVWISFVLAGLGLARADIRRPRTQVVAAVAGTVLAIIGYGAASASAPSPWLAPVWTADAHSSGLLEVVGSGGFALTAIGVSCLACRTAVSTIVMPLRATGSMPLTAYTLQIVVWALVIAWVPIDRYDFEEFQAIGLFWWIAIGVVAFCTAWAVLVGRGPLEWVVDRVARAVAPERPPVTTPSERERVDA